MASRDFFRDHVCVVRPLCASRDRWRERVSARTDEIAGGPADFSCAGICKAINHPFCSARLRRWGFAGRQCNAGNALEVSCRFDDTKAVANKLAKKGQILSSVIHDAERALSINCEFTRLLLHRHTLVT